MEVHLPEVEYTGVTRVTEIKITLSLQSLKYSMKTAVPKLLKAHDRKGESAYGLSKEKRLLMAQEIRKSYMHKNN